MRRDCGKGEEPQSVRPGQVAIRRVPRSPCLAQGPDDVRGLSRVGLRWTHIAIVLRPSRRLLIGLRLGHDSSLVLGHNQYSRPVRTHSIPARSWSSRTGRFRSRSASAFPGSRSPTGWARSTWGAPAQTALKGTGLSDWPHWGSTSRGPSRLAEAVAETDCSRVLCAGGCYC